MEQIMNRLIEVNELIEVINEKQCLSVEEFFEKEALLEEKSELIELMR